MDSTRFIQVIGTQRSGTNLLRVMLHQFKEISAPHPPHILKTFIPLLDRYGDLSDEKIFRRLTSDVLQWIIKNPVPWDDFHPSVDEILDRLTERNLFQLFIAVYKMKADIDNAKIACCKSTFNAHFYKSLEQTGLEPFYIHLVRDGRDVAQSFQYTPVGPKHVYHIAQKWVEDQKKCEEIKSKLPEERWITIHYEDLIHEPRKILKRLSKALHIQFSEDALDYYNAKESVHTAEAGEMWANLTKPILRANTGKYKTEFTAEELEIFGKVAGSTLDFYEYERQIIDVSNVKLDTELFEKLNAKKIGQVMQNTDPEEIRLRSEQSDVISYLNKVSP